MAEPEREPSGSASQIAKYSGHGLTLAVAVALFAWLGTLADARLGTGPLFVLLGTFGGFGAAFFRMYRDLVMSGEADED